MLQCHIEDHQDKEDQALTRIDHIEDLQVDHIRDLHHAVDPDQQNNHNNKDRNLHANII